MFGCKRLEVYILLETKLMVQKMRRLLKGNVKLLHKTLLLITLRS